jgi:hypothetical protein
VALQVVQAGTDRPEHGSRQARVGGCLGNKALFPRRRWNGPAQAAPGRPWSRRTLPGEFPARSVRTRHARCYFVRVLNPAPGDRTAWTGVAKGSGPELVTRRPARRSRCCMARCRRRRSPIPRAAKGPSQDASARAVGFRPFRPRVTAVWRQGDSLSGVPSRQKCRDKQRIERFYDGMTAFRKKDTYIREGTIVRRQKKPHTSLSFVTAVTLSHKKTDNRKLPILCLQPLLLQLACPSGQGLPRGVTSSRRTVRRPPRTGLRSVSNSGGTIVRKSVFIAHIPPRLASEVSLPASL